MCFTCTGHFNQDFKGVLSKGFVKLLSKYSRMLLGSNTDALFYSEVTTKQDFTRSLPHGKEVFSSSSQKGQ